MVSEFFLSRLCISSLVWRDRPLEEMALSAMRFGVRHMELVPDCLAPGHFQPEGNNSRLFNLLAEAGVSIAALRLTGMDQRQKIRTIAEAGERGIPIVIDRAERLVFPDLIDRLRLYSNLAARAGAMLILENDFHTMCDNAEAQLTLSGIVRHSSLAFGFVPGAAIEDKKDPRLEVLKLGPGLRLAYLWDSPVPAELSSAGHTEPTNGKPESPLGANDHRRVDWFDYFSALAEVRFRGLFNLRWAASEGLESWQNEEALARSIGFYANEARRAGLGQFG